MVIKEKEIRNNHNKIVKEYVQMDLELKNKHVLVTGASGGIGNEITKLFLLEEANVTAHFNTNNKTLEGFLSDNPISIQAVSADLRKEEDVQKLIPLFMK